jgi:hypothetical protein
MCEPLNRQAKGRSLEQRIFDYSMPEPNSGCWLWLGALNACGYGTIGVKYRSQLAHRISYSVFKGLVPKRKNVLHHCDMPCCVNPEHLFVGTQRDNVHDMEHKKRAYHPRGENHGLAKITEREVKLIRMDKRSERTIAKAMGLTRAIVRGVKIGRTWGHVL